MLLERSPPPSFNLATGPAASVAGLLIYSRRSTIINICKSKVFDFNKIKS